MQVTGDIAILGGTGFIGRHVCQLVDASAGRAIAVSRRPDRDFLASHAPFVEAMSVEQFVSDAALERRRSLKRLIYLAHSPIDYFATMGNAENAIANLTVAAAVLDAVLAANPQTEIVYVSSGGQVYGETGIALINEDLPTAPNTPYGFGKLLIEEHLRYLGRRLGASTLILRAANPVGRWQLGNLRQGLVAAAVRAATTGAPITIFGDGLNRRDYFAAADLAALMLRADLGIRPGVQAFNIGSGIARTERDILATVEAIAGTSLAVTFAPRRPFDQHSAVLDIGRAREALGWREATPLEHVVEDMLAAARKSASGPAERKAGN